MMHVGSEGWPMWSDPTDDTVAQINVGSERKVSQYTAKAAFCWETFGPAIHVDVTLKSTTYTSIVADYVHPFMELVFPGGRVLFQQDNVPCHKAKRFRAQQRV